MRIIYLRKKTKTDILPNISVFTCAHADLFLLLHTSFYLTICNMVQLGFSLLVLLVNVAWGSTNNKNSICGIKGSLYICKNFKISTTSDSGNKISYMPCGAMLYFCHLMKQWYITVFDQGINDRRLIYPHTWSDSIFSLHQ